MAKRYDQLIDIIREVRPATIVEVGVHKGLRAALMCREAMKYLERVQYIGYDIFDQADEQFHLDALNGKGAPNEQAAAARLDALGPGLKWRFVKGDTRLTLHGAFLPVDLAFIDGDHRLEVIRGDFEPFREAKCIVMDDFYPPSRNEVLDLNVYGCNGLVNELAADRTVEFLPVLDRCNHGAYTQLVAVWK
jgi:hypothetical protein